MPVNFTPLGTRVLLKRDTKKETIVGGILLPDASAPNPTEATVIAVGEGRVTDTGHIVPCSVRVGNRVSIPVYCGCEITSNGEQYLLVMEHEIQGII